MRQSRMEQWRLNEQRAVQESLTEQYAFIHSEYSYDLSPIIVRIDCSEKEVQEGQDCIPDHTMHFVLDDTVIMSLEFTRVSPELEDVLWHPEKTEYMPYGIAMKLSRIETAEKLSDQDLKALTHTISLLITYGLVLCEVSEMRRQPLAFQETWKMMWGDGKIVEYQEVHYLRYDDPIGWNAF